MIRLFTGWDARETIGWSAFAGSAIRKSSLPVSLTPLSSARRDGSNTFTYSRFLVPELCGYEGFAIFADGADMICMADLADLWRLCDPSKAVQVVKHDYKTKHRTKYLGTVMECDNRDYPRKNWSSVIIWNCGHAANRIVTDEYVAMASGLALHGFDWLADELIGALPAEWNWLADEYGKNPEAKILHFTAGIPAIPAYSSSPHAQSWFHESALANMDPDLTMPEKERKYHKA